MKRVLRLLCMLLPILAIAQPDTLWTRTFGGSDGEHCYAVQQTTDGGYIMTGYTFSFGAGFCDFWLVKADANGDSIWSRTYGGGSWDQPRIVRQTVDGGYVLAGYTNSFGDYAHDSWLVKTDTYGDSLWSHTYGETGSDDVCMSVVQTTDGGYALAGYSSGAGGHDFRLIKTDEYGNQLWSHTYGGNENEYCNSVQQTIDEGYVLAGVMGHSAPTPQDAWLVKTDSSGNLQWSHIFGGNTPDLFYSVEQTTDGGYVLSGVTNAGGYSNAWLVKTDSNGIGTWSHLFAGGIGSSARQTADGGYVLAGYATSFGAGSWDYWLVRTNSEGDSLWSRTFGGASYDWCGAVEQTSDGGYVLAGFTASFGSGEDDFYLVKTGPELSADDNFIPHPSSFILSSFPNPFNPTTTISFSLPKPGDVSLKVYDVTGRQVETLAEKRYDAGEHQVTFDGTTLPSGIYFAQMTAGTVTQTRKMVLLK